MISEIKNALKKHDQSVANSGLSIWIGSEPTFTLHTSEEPQWTSHALGGNKKTYAMRIVEKLHQRHPGSVVLRTVGRQYSGEELPRWSFGIYERRDKQAIWNDPPDPMLVTTQTSDKGKLSSFMTAIKQTLAVNHWHYKFLMSAQIDTEARFVVCFGDIDIANLVESDPELSRGSIHDEKTPETGLHDALAEKGFFLVVIREVTDENDNSSINIELPAFKTVTSFLQFLDVISQSANEAALDTLLFVGYPPPVDQSISWTTVTPDPAVIEINQAPEANISDFYTANRELFEIANNLRLSSYRLHYNGSISDSGGGGQFTLGGETPESSPFFIQPRLLPRLIRYFNFHPALSYLFATYYVGSASQSPRTDENTRDSFHELTLALEQLERQIDISPKFLYESFAPFLTDASGNSHRSELNIEKLWNTYLPLRGCLGLMEFRAFRMPYTSERSVAIAVLLRAITTMLSKNDLVTDLHDWRDELHDRFALPFFLQQDLNAVITDLEKTGYGLEPCIQSELTTHSDRFSWSTSFEGCRVDIDHAVEFWPLVGDVASQESGGSRLVDSSTLRLQILLRQYESNKLPLAGWQLQYAGYTLPLHVVSDGENKVCLAGLRYRDFVPWRGLHPYIQPSSPLSVLLIHPKLKNALQITLHNWRVDKNPYDGLPKNFDEARHRQDERLVVSIIHQSEIAYAKKPPKSEATGFTYDLRNL
jgi:uncharacterized protein (DUF2126 family)